MQRRTNTRHGFTLVELSIVLVIIGLIIGGVLTGQQIMQNARITNALNGIQAYEAQFQTYVQNYGALPGDDGNAYLRFQNSGLTKCGDNSGTVDGNFDSNSSSDETVCAWADLRAAGLVKNQVVGTTGTTAIVQPPNPFNGIYGFQTGAFNNAISTTVICLNKVPAAAAQAIDSRLDDGSSNTGNVQAIPYAPGDTGKAMNTKAADSYGTNDSYTLCIRM